MYTAFDFDEYWDNFTQSPCPPEFWDPVEALMHCNEQIDQLADESDWTLFP